ncbi:MAG: hypothetical protein Q8Q09_15820 [Deltaproteobacteria bacterium]|nr:hypothetical protein [Deltaproteobacteria bacterium]
MKQVMIAVLVAMSVGACAPVGGGGGPITVGGMADGFIGFLTPESTIPGRSGTTQYRRELYTVSLTAGMPVTLLMCRTSVERFDPYLAIHGPVGPMDNVETNDDSAGDYNSRLIYTPMTTGVHTIYATTFSSFSSNSNNGAYRLTVTAGANPTATCPAI